MPRRQYDESRDGLGCVCGDPWSQHYPKGYFNDVLEPRFRPSAAQCSGSCYLNKRTPDDTAYIHEFEPKQQEAVALW